MYYRCFVTGLLFNTLILYRCFATGEHQQPAVPGGAGGVRRAREVQLPHGGDRRDCGRGGLPAAGHRAHPDHLPAPEHQGRAHLPQAADPARQPGEQRPQ